MEEVLAQLIRLQKEDIRRLTLQGEKESLDAKIVKMKELLKEMEQDLGDKKDRLSEAERWYEEKEREMKEEEDQIKKLQARLNLTTKPKEYTNLQKEIEERKKRNKAREDEILKLLEVMEDFKSSVQEEEAKVEELRQKVIQEENDARARREEIDQELEIIEQKVKELEKGIPLGILRKYKRIQKAWKGLAVVEVDVATRSCGGCHRQIPPQLFNTILNSDKLHQCPHCQRFIYINLDELKESE